MANQVVNKSVLYSLGIRRVRRFCKLNKLQCPEFKYHSKETWHWDHCGYYRPTTINVCVHKCAQTAGEARSRNWNWPGSKTDRTPYGVVCHELGHHIDWLLSDKEGKYYGDYSIGLHNESEESALTSYCPNEAEWFAEMFRLFVTNPSLLCVLRPTTFDLMCYKLTPVINFEVVPWQEAFPFPPPSRIIEVLEKQIK
jgi:hypothetical protein